MRERERDFTRMGGCILDHLRQIIVYAPEIWELVQYEAEALADAATHVDNRLHVLEPLVRLEDLVHE